MNIAAPVAPNELFLILQEYTSVYQSFHGNSIPLREAACMRILWPARVLPIEPDDLFAGRMCQPPLGIIGQSDESALGYYFHPLAFQKLLNHPELSPENKTILEEIGHFWETENTVSKAKAAYSTEMKTVLPSDDYIGESGIAFTLWRMSGIQLDYSKLIAKGISGLKTEIESASRICKDSEKRELYVAMIEALNTFSEVARYYASLARIQSIETNIRARKEELLFMSSILEKIACEKPETVREGLQLMYLYSVLDGTRNYGRMDDYLSDLYEADYGKELACDEEIIRLLGDIWKLMHSRNYRYDTRIIIGGLGRQNEIFADKLALLIIETSSRIREIVPQLALRFHKNQNTDLFNKALNLIASGYPFPLLYNDEVNIPAVKAAFGVNYDEAIHAIQYGCGEYVLNHRSVGTPSGIINLLQALLVTMNKGIDPKTSLPMGLPRKNFKKYNDFETFEDLWQAYKDQVEYHIVQLALHEELEYQCAGKENAYLLTSILMDDCIARGKGVFSGGIRYLGGTLESYGNSNLADSLLAIKELVYERKLFSLLEINEILRVNFLGFENERRMLLNCPKYGNDNDQADEMLVKVHEHVCNFTASQNKNTSLHSYLVVIINNDANTVMGLNTPASPDGRLAFSPLANGNNPSGGSDKMGVTSFLNSLNKPRPDIHAGAVQNMKFSKEMFSQHRQMLEILLKTYFETGGTQAMITVVGKTELEDAMAHPENYQNLIVRVGGFSERFVNLPVETQLEVLSRTLNG